MSLMIAHQSRIRYHEDWVTPIIHFIHYGDEQCLCVKQGYEKSHLDKNKIIHHILFWFQPYS